MFLIFGNWKLLGTHKYPTPPKQLTQPFQTLNRMNIERPLAVENNTEKKKKNSFQTF